ncbi:hypothetical protein FCU45_02865 [Sulfurimonas crateris]|uniref:DUF4136 domain-containing protein n=1 Tax=Sulfurimonas crateris TaxID=2574727 RepID=A0A4U2Z782_9BACT|nr:hypothetical protein [Sulfurimonas crateris]TKI70246.1 hypothetical protein FCU45_02865 [Sulfurimonas crateris]
MKNTILVLLLFLFAGCDGKIYKNIYDKSKIGVTIPSIEVVANDERSLVISQNIMEKKGFIVGKSDYMLRVEYRDYTLSCTNPLSKTSSDYTYEGLLVLELFYNGNKVYSIYRDIKKDVSEKHYLTLIEIMLEDLELKRG